MRSTSDQRERFGARVAELKALHPEETDRQIAHRVLREFHAAAAAAQQLAAAAAPAAVVVVNAAPVPVATAAAGGGGGGGAMEVEEEDDDIYDDGDEDEDDEDDEAGAVARAIALSMADGMPDLEDDNPMPDLRRRRRFDLGLDAGSSSSSSSEEEEEEEEEEASAVARAIALSMADVVESASSDEMPDLVESTSSDDSDAEEEEEESDDGDMFDLAALEDDGREETNASRLAVEDWNTVLTTEGLSASAYRSMATRAPLLASQIWMHEVLNSTAHAGQSFVHPGGHGRDAILLLNPYFDVAAVLTACDEMVEDHVSIPQILGALREAAIEFARRAPFLAQMHPAIEDETLVGLNWRATLVHLRGVLLMLSLHPLFESLDMEGERGMLVVQTLQKIGEGLNALSEDCRTVLAGWIATMPTWCVHTEEAKAASGGGAAAAAKAASALHFGRPLQSQFPDLATVDRGNPWFIARRWTKSLVLTTQKFIDAALQPEVPMLGRSPLDRVAGLVAVLALLQRASELSSTPSKRALSDSWALRRWSLTERKRNQLTQHELDLAVSSERSGWSGGATHTLAAAVRCVTHCAHQRAAPLVDPISFYSGVVNGPMEQPVDEVQEDWWTFVDDAQTWLRRRARDVYASSSNVPLLERHPFLFDASRKHELVRYYARTQQREASHAAIYNRLFDPTAGGNPDFVLEVRREHIVVDTIRAVERVFSTPGELRKSLRVKFAGEEGIDEGGVRREFFQVLMRQLVDPEIGMFCQAGTEELLWINARWVSTLHCFSPSLSLSPLPFHSITCISWYILTYLRTYLLTYLLTHL